MRRGKGWAEGGKSKRRSRGGELGGFRPEERVGYLRPEVDGFVKGAGDDEKETGKKPRAQLGFGGVIIGEASSHRKKDIKRLKFQEIGGGQGEPIHFQKGRRLRGGLERKKISDGASTKASTETYHTVEENPELVGA